MRRIYIITKLFNINDRFVSLKLCKKINNWIRKNELGELLDECFLPYRDSNAKVSDKENKTYEIFKMDCETIQNSAVLAGYFDGPSYDSGIGFEIGYAYILGIPVILLTTDYFYWIVGSEAAVSINKLAKALVDVIHVRNPKGKNLDYKSELFDIEGQVYDALKAKIRNSLSKPKKLIELQGTKDIDLFMDINFFRYEVVKKAVMPIVNKWISKGKIICIPNEGDYANANKICNLINRSRKVCIYGDNFDMEVDSSILQGLAFGMNVEIYLFSNLDESLYQSDDFVLYKNPMIEHSIKRMLQNLDELESLLV